MHTHRIGTGRGMPMRTVLLAALSVLVLVGFTVNLVGAEEAVIVACAVGALVPGYPSAFVLSCDKSSNVPGVCPVYGGAIEDPAVSCAQTLAYFLSLPDYKLVNVQTANGNLIYMIVRQPR